MNTRTYTVVTEPGFDPGPEAIPDVWQPTPLATWCCFPVVRPSRYVESSLVLVMWSIDVEEVVPEPDDLPF